MRPGDTMTKPLTGDLIATLRQTIIVASTDEGFESTPIWIDDDPRSVVREAIKTIEWLAGEVNS